MDIYIFNNKEDLYENLSSYMLGKIKDSKEIRLGLATGSTPIPLYQKLILDYQNNQTNYEHVTSINLDEYIGLEPTHFGSYNYFMEEELFKHIPIKDKHVPKSKGNQDENCDNYNQLLEKKIDLQLLGIGANGHIGFNEPGTSFDSKTHVVELTEQTKTDNARFFSSIEEVPTHAITMGLKDIMNANEIILVATGKNKAEAIFKSLQGTITEEVPGSVLQKHNNLKVFLDLESASLLRK